MGVHGRYQMLRKVADGGMAEIYLARQTGDEGFSRLVIVKRVLPGFASDPHFRNMLVDEAHIAMTLNHTNVVPVLDLGRAEGSFFLVMELVDGWDLGMVYQRGHDAGFPFPLGLALYVIAETCRGLAYAHGRRDGDGRPLGIVHRDVSPQNVLLSEHGEVRLTDFGIAKALNKRERTQTGIIKGKLDFMSPEQALGGDIDSASDIFAAGTMLYLLATGKRPFASPSDFEALLRVQRAEFTPAEAARPGLSAGVAAIIKRAMQLRTADRYRSAEEMTLAVEAVMREEFGSPGQSQLKRWLTELAQRDGALPVSKRPGMAPPEAQTQTQSSLEQRWFAEGEMLSFDDSSNVSSKLSPAGSFAPSPAQITPLPAPVSFVAAAEVFAPSSAAVAPSAMHAAAAPPRRWFRRAPRPLSLPMALGASGQMAMAGPMTMGAPAPMTMSRTRGFYRPRRRWLRRLAVLALLVAAGAFAADRLLSEQQQRQLQDGARALVQRGVEGVSSVIDRSGAPARPEPLPPSLEGPGARAGARARLPDEDHAARAAADRARDRRPAERVTITLLSNPSGASVTGPPPVRRPLGSTPLPMTVKAGTSQTLTFSKDGYAPVSRKITADAAGTVVIDLERRLPTMPPAVPATVPPPIR
jgi:serine/threonine protein kinase